MAIYDAGTASLVANGTVTGVGTTWQAPLTLIRVGATIVFKTEPVKIYTISEIISDTQINVYNPNSETVPAGTGYAILAHDGITVQGLAQDVAETLRYYQSNESYVAQAIDAFANFDANDFDTKVTQVNTQHTEVVSTSAQVSADASQVIADKDSAAASAASASADKDAAAVSAQEAADYAASLNTSNLLRKDLNLSDVADKSIARTSLDVYSKAESASRFIGDLVSYGADNTGNTPVDSSFDAMISDGRFVVSSGVYLISSTKNVDIGQLKEVSISEDVVFLIKTDIDGFVFRNPIANFNANGMRIEVDIDGGGYSHVALTLRGSNYYTGPQNFSRLSQRTFFGNFYTFNKQGAIKQESASVPVNDEGYGFSIDCNSSDQEILIWNDIDVSSTGFTNAHAIGVGTNSLNFISSMDLNLVSWFSTNHFVDNSLPQSDGNVAGGIGDIKIRLKSQPHAMMQKIVKISNGIGFMDGCFFDLTIWDPNLIDYRAGIVDATTGNHYTNTLERLSYPLTRALNVVNASLFPVKNFSSTIQDSNVIVNSSSEIAKYLYFSNVTPSMTMLEAFNAVNTWCVSNNVKSDFEFRLSLLEATGNIRSVFQPWLNEIQDDTGFISIFGHYYSGAMSTIRCIYQVNSITSGGKIEEHEILWNRSSNLVSHRLKEYTYGTTAEIRSKKDFQPVGFTTFDTTFGIPVWYNGTSWLKADGSVAYGV